MEGDGVQRWLLLWLRRVDLLAVVLIVGVVLIVCLRGLSSSLRFGCPCRAVLAIWFLIAIPDGCFGLVFRCF